MLDETASTRPYIEEVSPLPILREEYERGAGHFVKQIDYLQSIGYKGIRRTRGDGDCFYRCASIVLCCMIVASDSKTIRNTNTAIAFAYIERAMKSDDKTLAVASMLSTLDSMIPILEAAGFQKIVFEDWYECLSSLISQIVVPEPDNTPNGTLLTPAILLEAFQNVEGASFVLMKQQDLKMPPCKPVSNCIVVFLRLLTSAQIRMDPDTFAPFLFHQDTGEECLPQEFCERYVEAVGKEAGNACTEPCS